jgi:trypsin
MGRLRTLLTPALAAAALAVAAAPAQAIVGGHAAQPGEYPAVAEVVIASTFHCTGTLVAPSWVLTAGHCGSLTGDLVASPAAWPPSAIEVRLGSVHPGQGDLAPVQDVVIEPNYLLTKGYDISLLHLASPAAQAPVRIAGQGEEGLWAPGTMETIVGFGLTSQNAANEPDTLQEANVPVTTDDYCANAYPSDFDAATMVCAGYPQGGVDTCQGDSGGPLFAHTATGEPKVVGATSFGQGCAQPGEPGVYARVAGPTLRTWIASQAPDAVDPPASSGTEAVSVSSPPAAPAARRHHTRKRRARSCRRVRRRVRGHVRTVKVCRAKAKHHRARHGR